MLRRLALLIMLLPATATAEFLPEEVTSLRSLRSGIHAAWDTIAAECGTETSDHGACDWALSGVWQAQQSMGWFIHINANPNASAGATLLAGPRENVVAEAVSDLNRAIFELGSRTGTMNMSSALAHLSAVDVGLGYLDPWPPNHPAQFGPHGFYDKDQLFLWVVQRYAVDFLREFIDAQQDGLVCDFSDMFAQMNFATRQSRDIWTNQSHIIDTVGTFGSYTNNFTESLEEGDTRRAFVSSALGGQRSASAPGVGDRYHRVVDRGLDDAFSCLVQSDPAKQAAIAAELAQALREFSDSWRHLDAWFDSFLQIHFIPGTDIPVPPGFD